MLESALEHGWLFSSVGRGRRKSITYIKKYFVLSPPSATLEFSVASAEEKPPTLHEFGSDLGSTPGE